MTLQWEGSRRYWKLIARPIVHACYSMKPERAQTDMGNMSNERADIEWYDGVDIDMV